MEQGLALLSKVNKVFEEEVKAKIATFAPFYDDNGQRWENDQMHLGGNVLVPMTDGQKKFLLAQIAMQSTLHEFFLRVQKYGKNPENQDMLGRRCVEVYDKFTADKRASYKSEWWGIGALTEFIKDGFAEFMREQAQGNKVFRAFIRGSQTQEAPKGFCVQFSDAELPQYTVVNMDNVTACKEVPKQVDVAMKPTPEEERRFREVLNNPDTPMTNLDILIQRVLTGEWFLYWHYSERKQRYHMVISFHLNVPIRYQHWNVWPTELVTIVANPPPPPGTDPNEVLVVPDKMPAPPTDSEDEDEEDNE